MAVYYKFRSAKDFYSIPIHGHFISVANLKEKIFESKRFGSGTDFDLIVSNAQTNEEYDDEAVLIPQNTSLIIRRVAGWPRLPILIERDKSKSLKNSGAVAILKPNEDTFDKKIKGLSSTPPVIDLPPELCCPICKNTMKEAVLSRCCFNSFCHQCIRNHILSKSMCVCGATKMLADLIPNKTLRQTINRILELTTSSTESDKSSVLVQDMESTRGPQSEVLPPTLSAAIKEECAGHLCETDTPILQETVKERNTAFNSPKLSLKKGQATKNVNQSEVTKESVSLKESTLQSTTPRAEEIQQKLPFGGQGKKKKKKTHPCSNGDLQPFGPSSYNQFLGGIQYGMDVYNQPFFPSAYNPFWGGMQLGMDGYNQPYVGPMPPYMGYTPGIFDAPSEGFFPQDTFGAGDHGYMTSFIPMREFSNDRDYSGEVINSQSKLERKRGSGHEKEAKCDHHCNDRKKRKLS